MFKKIYSYFKTEPIRFIILAVFIVLLVCRVVFWYYPIGGNHAASFFSKDLTFTVNSTDKTGEVDLRSDPEGKFLMFLSSSFFNFYDVEIFMSSDEGVSWGREDEFKRKTTQVEFQDLGSDFFVSPNGDYGIVSIVRSVNDWSCALIYRSSKHLEGQEIYRTNCVTEKGAPEYTDGLDIEQTKDGLWIFFVQGTQSNYRFKLLRSKDGDNWYEDYLMQGLSSRLSYPSSFIEDYEGTSYLTMRTYDVYTEKIGNVPFENAKNIRFNVMKGKKDTYSWEKISDSLGKRGPGRGFGGGDGGIHTKDNKIFVDEKGNLYIIWRHHFSKPKASSILYPLDLFQHIPVLSLLYAFSALDMLDREDIYFSTLAKDSNRFAAAKRINNKVFSYEFPWSMEQELSKTHTKQFLELVSRHSLQMRSSVSKNGKYLAVAWADSGTEGEKLIYLTYSKDYGQHWSRSQKISTDFTDGIYDYDSLDIFVVNDGSLHLIFKGKKDNIIYHVSGQIE